MKEFTVNGRNYIAVEVPEGSANFQVINMEHKPHINWLLFNRPLMGDMVGSGTKIPTGNYEIIGKVKDTDYYKIAEWFNIHPTDIGEIESTLIHHNLSDNDLILERK